MMMKNQREGKIVSLWTKTVGVLLTVAIVMSFTVTSAFASTTSFIIKVDGVQVATVDVEDIENLSSYDSGAVRYYSATNSANFTSYYSAQGATLEQILYTYANIGIGDIDSMTIIAEDEYYVATDDPDTRIFGTKYYYPSGGGSGIQVPAIIATAARGGIGTTGLDQLNTLRLFIGQASQGEQMSSWDIKYVSEIDIITN